MAMNAIDVLITSNIYTSMRMTLVKNNVHDVRNYIKLAVSKGVNRCIIERMTLMENKPDALILEPSIGDILKTFKIMSEYKQVDGLKIGSNDPLWLLFRENEIVKYLDKDYLCGGCTAGVAAISVNPDLTVSPCPRLPVISGDLKEHSLEHIWNKSKIFQNIRNRDLFEGCALCHFKYICGGCRGAAHAHGSYLGKDPHCWRLKDELCDDGHSIMQSKL
jgi:radical SAM protein with 4Fe4S-binding SPASM domain